MASKFIIYENVKGELQELFHRKPWSLWETKVLSLVYIIQKK